MHSKILGLVILYHPPEDILLHISTYIDKIDFLYIVDNTEPFTNNHLIDEIITRWGNKVTCIINDSNQGIAHTLNSIISISLSKGYKYILTVDQDSSFIYSDVSFQDGSAFLEENKNVALLSYMAHSPIKEVLYLDRSHLYYRGIYADTFEAITSGMLLNMEICKELGYFNEDLFIDEVDNEYCLRVIEKGFYVFKTVLQHLSHSIGFSKKYRNRFFPLKKKTFGQVHNPIRTYYMVRNRFYIANKYKNIFPEVCKKKIKQNIKLKQNIIKYYPRMLEYLKMYKLGEYHYKIGKMGKLENE
ncbi:MAG: hypothetical protein QM536_09780 [Chitinophagaceae bacterium]|nr:hypothetical protein [Chitinophagaceae bacterium]